LKAGKADEAAVVYKQDLQKYPENPWSLFGLSEALKASGKTDEARAAHRRYEKAWAKADFEMVASCLCMK